MKTQAKPRIPLVSEPLIFQTFQSGFSLSNKLARVLWAFAYFLLFRFTPPVPGFWAWRRIVMRVFGAKVGKGVWIYPTARIWAPWNLELKPYSRIGSWTDIYNIEKILLGEHSWVSQYSYLCTTSHDINDPAHRMVASPIIVGKGVWIAADVFVGAGVTIGDGAVLGARSSVFKDVAPWSVVGGNPAKIIKIRDKKRFVRPIKGRVAKNAV